MVAGRKPILTTEEKFKAYYLNREAPESERLSTIEIASKEFLNRLNQSTVSRGIISLAEELDPTTSAYDLSIKEEYEKWKSERREPKALYTKIVKPDGSVTFQSIYPTVQSYINAHRGMPTEESTIRYAQKAWAFLGKKDPKNWTQDDFWRFVRSDQVTEKLQFIFACAMRAVSPPLMAIDGLTRGLKKIEVYKVNIFLAEFKEIIANPELSDFERLLFKLHVTLGCREGSRGKGGLLYLTWEKWSKAHATLDVFESKTRGGVTWLDCPLDAIDPNFPKEFEEYWVKKGRPVEGRIFEGLNYTTLIQIYQHIKKACKIARFTPHAARKIHVNILANDYDIPLEIVAGDPPHGLMGVGWEDLTTLKKFYLSISLRRLAVMKEKAYQVWGSV